MIKIPIEKINSRWDQLSDELRHFIYSLDSDDKLDEVSKNSGMSDGQRSDLGLLFEYVVLGFIPTQEIFESIKSNLGTDSKKSIEIFHGLEKIIQPLKKEIDENYATNKAESLEFKEVNDPKMGPRQVILKQGQTVLDLKNEDIIAKVKASSEPTPFILGRINIDQNVPVNTARPVSIPKPTNQPIQAPPQPKQSIVYPSSQIGGIEDVEIPGGPMIIHRHEEAQSVGATRPSGTFKQATFGGAFGSYRSNPAPKSGPAISRAQVTMSPSSDMIPKTEQKVPLTVKSFDNQNKTEPTKVTHYSAFMTPLGKPTKPSKNEGNIDLDKMTFTK